ncbi:ATP-binding protein [Kitasatospora aureofaciens]|nr:ATP-binding protein [Kitasatospora aureofaciens]ARF83000.1 hypothetical protein B6264_22135 [Kitasatospora aureofaciens]
MRTEAARALPRTPPVAAPGRTCRRLPTAVPPPPGGEVARRQQWCDMPANPAVTASHGAGTGPVLSGRHRESKALERVLATPGGGCVSGLVQGGWGSGKTSVLRAARAGARENAATRVVSASADPLECGLRHAVVRQLFERLLADGADSPYGGRTPGSARRPAPWAPQPSGPSDPMAGQDAAALRDLYQLATQLTAQGSLLVAVDDLQWSDTTSLRWLRHLLHRADDLPLADIATLGPEDARSNSAGIAAAVPLFQHRLTLGGLSDEAVGSLAEEVLGEVGADQRGVVGAG